MIGCYGHEHWNLQLLFESPWGNIHAVMTCDILCILCQNLCNYLLKLSTVFNLLYVGPTGGTLKFHRGSY